MARPLRLDYPGAIWHITSRGNERRPIFRDDSDRMSFVRTLADVVVLNDWLLHAWVLMDTHYHLLVETPRAPTLSRGIKRLNESYAQRFNDRHARVGHLFQGRFKGILVERESHLLELTRYIVLNPVRCGAVRFASEWLWSNYRATAGLAPAPAWLDINWTLDQFDPFDRGAAHDAYRRFVADGRGAAYNPWEEVGGQIYLGGKAFFERMQELIDSKPRSREHPRVQRRVVTPSFESIIERVMAEFVLPDEAAFRRKTRQPYRRALAHLAWTDGAVPMVSIAEWLGVSERAVSKMVRASERLERVDRKYGARLAAVRSRLRQD